MKMTKTFISIFYLLFFSGLVVAEELVYPDFQIQRACEVRVEIYNQSILELVASGYIKQGEYQPLTEKDVQYCIGEAPSYIALIKKLKVSQADIDTAVKRSEEYGTPVDPVIALLELWTIIDKFCEENAPDSIEACLKEKGYPID